MTYLVMECHFGYAVVLDSEGRYLRVANQNFVVGQQVTEVIPFETPKRLVSPRRWATLATTAACLCLVVSLWLLALLPFGTVRLQINPDVLLTVNRLNFVIDAEGLNEDGRNLLQGFDYKRMKLPQVSDALADRATAEGYLAEDGTIVVTVSCRNENWRTETEAALVAELERHMAESITVTPQTNPAPDNSQQAQSHDPVTVPPNNDSWDDRDDDWDDDDRDDRDDDDDDDDWDDD